ncbi:MAG: saccharopine dehydrogenase C-terminal domain-containing protein [Candidatus Eisenbacteria bacterium]|nr:saccharopine dehydrogenase C-terminal domain-containing protein [Candidatus Eisenbacteria bacterium]
MRMLVLGGGLMGRAAAWDMCRQPDVGQVTIADVDGQRAKEAAEFAQCDCVRHMELDVKKTDDMLAVMKEADAVLGAVSYTVNLELSELAIEAGVHFNDMGGNNTVVAEQLKLDERAKAAGVSIVPDTGLAPGMVCPLAMHGVRKMDEAETVRIRVGGLPQKPRPPLNYMLVFSVEGLINEYVEPCVAIRGGKIVENVEPLVDIEEITFPPPFGTLEAFNTSGGTSTLPHTLLGLVRELDYKTIRYPGHADKMRTILELGLMDSAPVDAGGLMVPPRSVLERVITNNVPKGSDDIVLVRVTVEGKKDGKWARAVYEMVDYRDERTGLTAMMRGTALPASIICLMMARGETAPGAIPQELAIDGDRFIEEILARGMPLKVRLETA